MSLEINGTLLREALVLANFPASASLGTAAATVDVLSHAIVTQTTAGVALTLPVPTDPRSGQEFRVTNAGTVALLVNGLAIGPGLHAGFVWASGAWRNPVSQVPIYREIRNLPANTNVVITHNLGGSTPALVDVRDANGAVVANVRVVAETANTVTLRRATLLNNARITIIS